MVPPPANASTDDNNTRHYEAYFHALLQNTGASKLKLVRDDAILSDALEEANFLLGTSIPHSPSAQTITVELDGIPSRPCRQPSDENLLELLSRHHSTTETVDDSSENPKCSPAQHRQAMRSWSSERAQRNKSQTPFLEVEAFAPISRLPPIKGRGVPFRKTIPKRKQCRWSASAIPTAIGKIP